MYASQKSNNSINSSNMKDCKIDSGIHFNFNSMVKWDTYKINNDHIIVFIERVSTISFKEQFSIVDIKNKFQDGKLMVRELKIKSEKNESWTELEIETNSSPLKYYYKYIKKTINSKPSKNCFYAFLINKRKIK
ncbi:MAG: hypothetical protein ACXVHN_06650 [Methanobacterium sp.]